MQALPSVAYVSDSFGEKSFSWLLQDDDSNSGLFAALKNEGVDVEGTFFGMYYCVDDFHYGFSENNEIEIIVPGTDSSIKDLVDTIAYIFEIKGRDNIEAMMRERLSYHSLSDRRGRHITAYLDGKCAGYSSYGLSSDGQAMHLTGGGVRKSYRNRGLCSALLSYRERLAKENNCSIAVVSAGEGTSEPILRKMGYSVASKFVMMVKR